ncbi:MAG: ACT domain-containing protein [Phototrophicaceae bacterium]|jgi:hypothetical protein
MTGETNLAILLKTMQPRLNPGKVVFCSFSLDVALPSITPIGWFRESEGITLILPKEEATALQIPFLFEAGWITLDVHSSMDAVGFLAVISKALTDAGIPCNAVSAYYHDHLFIPTADLDRALDVLESLSQ